MREAPSLRIIQMLLEAGAQIKAYDPVAMKEAKRKLGNSIEFSEDKFEALIDVDAMVLVTEWPEFRVLNYKVLHKLLKEKVIFDGRNIYDADEMLEYGFTYYSIGKQAVNP
jgi:UDPglucose 6-dehydrogenase